MDEQIKRNLADAGAPPQLIDGIHTEQKKLDCLDYLIFSLRNGD